MDYGFSTAPADFAAALAAADIPPLVKTAVQATWGANDHSGANYEIAAATGTTWTVVRIAQVNKVA